jgi:hypothetical protein
MSTSFLLANRMSSSYYFHLSSSQIVRLPSDVVAEYKLASHQFHSHRPIGLPQPTTSLFAPKGDSEAGQMLQLDGLGWFVA